MAPSIPTSTLGDFPVEQPSLVKHILHLLYPAHDPRAQNQPNAEAEIAEDTPRLIQQDLGDQSPIVPTQKTAKDHQWIIETNNVQLVLQNIDIKKVNAMLHVQEKKKTKTLTSAQVQLLLNGKGHVLSQPQPSFRAALVEHELEKKKEQEERLMARAKAAANADRVAKKKAAMEAAKRLHTKDLTQWVIDCTAWQVIKDGWVKGQGSCCPAKPKQPKVRKPVLDVSKSSSVKAREYHDSMQVDTQDDGGEEDDDRDRLGEEEVREDMEGEQQQLDEAE
ncbi:hypothetical protein BS47DRAFT_1400542 [Hydnum rufescens UP504]|uniref:Uncharacterized protein n=1 Tax=Hydnum rufescens UP504 TaxID=1448309 RepID=A0A9P6AI40_9AGAM|nr:hypothetical protein BS47DRAFT_1400542 [Hydnum rufescens UP504]